MSPRNQPPVPLTPTTRALALAIMALLVAGLVGISVHHQGTGAATSAAHPPATAGLQPQTSTTGGTPANFVRVLDEADRVSLAVPPRWQVLNVSKGRLATELGDLRASDAAMGPLIDTLQAALTQIQFGVFAVDLKTRTILYSYGADLPSGVSSIDQIPTAEVVKEAEAVGGTSVHASRVNLPIGPAGQVSAQFTIKGSTISEALDYLVVGGRRVTLVVQSRGAGAPMGVLRQIEPTLVQA